jgi:hypothetical protein
VPDKFRGQGVDSPRLHHFNNKSPLLGRDEGSFQVYISDFPKLNDLMNEWLPKLASLGPLGSLGTLSLAVILFLCGCVSQEKKAPTDPVGQIKMGETYSVGTWKILKNDETAAEWYRKAALQGDPEGKYRLGLCYDRGLGVPKNEALAAKWFSKAAQGGNASAQHELGDCYRLAKGVGTDLPKAYFWCNLAAASGNDDARDARDALARRLTKEEICQAQRQSQEFWNKTKG